MSHKTTEFTVSAVVPLR